MLLIKKCIIGSHDVTAFLEVLILLILGFDDEDFFDRPKGDILDALAALSLPNILGSDPLLTEHPL
jgi:hypothetical protein